MNLPGFTAASGMSLTVTPYMILYILPAVIAAELALYSWHWRHIRAAIPFSFLMTAVVFWSVCHAASVASSTLEATLFWAQLQYGGIVLVAPLWLLFALTYHHTSSQHMRRHRGWLLLPAVVSFAAVLANDWHHLWWSTVALDTTRPFGSLSVTRGLLFWFHLAYSYGCIMLGFGLLLHRMFLSSPLQQRQAQLIAIGALFPVAGNFAHIFGLRTNMVDDPTPFLFAASGLLTFYAALRYHFPDLTPVTPQAFFASLPDGLVVLNQGGIVTAFNERVPRLLALATEGRNWIGRTFQHIIAGSPLEIDLRALFIPPAMSASRMITYTHEHNVRGVELRLCPLYDDNLCTGWVLVVRDRTDRTHTEQLIEQQMHELTLINRLARAVNAARVMDDLVQALTRELLQVLPQDRMVIGLLQPSNAMLYQVVDEQHHSVPTLEAHEVTANDVMLLHNVLTMGRIRVMRISDPLLDGTATQTIFQQYAMRTILAVPLVNQVERLGVMFVGHIDDRAITPGELHLFAIVGEMVTEAIIRTRLFSQDQQANEDTTTVLATITHELRTPLTSIIGFVDLLDRGVYGEVPEHIHEPLAHMRRNSRTLLRLINDILNFSKIAAGQFTIELAPVDLASVIQDVVSTVEPQIHERGLMLQLELASDMPPVYANRERLEQVLTNLLANAIKFTQEGSITVRTRYEGEYVRFSVADTGIGIAPEQQRVVFQAFQQLENGYQGRYPGTGLGLAISQRLMELMGGSLSLESTLGSGSTFSGDVPIVPAILQGKEQGITS
jgi:signal transduction histidine kinase